MIKKGQSGITLIALVVTIVVLLILAGVSISMLSGENGIITQAEKSTIKNDNGTVLESLKLKISEYIADNNGSEIKDKLYLLRNDNIINEESVVNVEKLVGQKLKTGNGSNNKDIYTIEDNHLYYYTKKEEKIELGDLGELGNMIPETDPNLFEVSDDGTISLKDYDLYYYNTKEWTIENVVIPREVDGKVVTKIRGKLFGKIGGNYFNSNKNIKSIVIPDTVTSIEGWAFSGCTNLKSVIIPNSVTSMGQNVFENCTSIKEITIPSSVTDMSFYIFYGWTSFQTIKIEFTESNLPSGWITSPGSWKEGCDAVILYGYVNNEYTKFCEKYLVNKNENELEELMLKSLAYIGTFEDFLVDINETRYTIEQEASNINMTYVEYLKYTLTYELSTSSWLNVEYAVSLNGGTGKSIQELEKIFLEKIGKTGTFDDFLSEGGLTREQFEENIKQEGFRTEEDFLKYYIYCE